MKTSKLLLATILMLFANLIVTGHHSGKKGKKHHRVPQKTHVFHYPPDGHQQSQNFVKKVEENDDDNDNEIPEVATSLPPNVPGDVYMNNESPDDVIPPSRLVDFIGIKHRFSNATNQAFPPYTNIVLRENGKNIEKIQNLRSGLGSIRLE